MFSMHDEIKTFAIVVSGSGRAGLVIPHLRRGELLEAIWIPDMGLRLRAAQGNVWIALTPSGMQENFAGTTSLQVLETSPGLVNCGWEVPLTGAHALHG